MLSIELIRKDLKRVEEGLKKRGDKSDLSALLNLDEQRRSILKKIEELRFQRNNASDEIGKLKREGKSAEEKPMSPVHKSTTRYGSPSLCSTSSALFVNFSSSS